MFVFAPHLYGPGQYVRCEDARIVSVNIPSDHVRTQAFVGDNRWPMRLAQNQREDAGSAACAARDLSAGARPERERETVKVRSNCNMSLQLCLAPHFRKAAALRPLSSLLQSAKMHPLGDTANHAPTAICH